MQRDRLIRRWLTDWQRGRLSRRELLRRLALLGLSSFAIANLLAACGQAESTPTPASGATTPSESTGTPASGTAGIPDYIDPSKLEKELNFYNWSEYIDPDILTEFEQTYGVKVTMDTYASNEDLLAKLQGGATGYDVIVPSDYMVSIMINLGMLEPLDYSIIKTIENIDPENLHAYYDPQNTYSVPYMWGTSGYSYDTATLGDDLASWKEVFEPRPEVRGKVVMLDDQREVIGAALMYLGYEINETSDEALARAKELLLAQKPYVLAYSSQNNDDLLVAGEALISHIWTGDALMSQQEKPSLRYVIPIEGCTVWQDNLCVPKTAPHKYAAMAFIDFLNRADVAGRNANYIMYGSPNKAAREQGYIDEEVLKNPGVYPPPEVWKRLQWIKDVGEEGALKFDRLWTEIKTG
ncbi:spermidine/putrescine ABC transporter substrate-binding protein [Thermomicrobium sp. 4228-Ro]|uniref:polyamine ABC transporter substrate-binding protein n=1 Tax=Thermomicrobium sp. 4228-Ro TaxID=2993937 RepID=UPI002248FFB2|nr:spermidine/putrescine ABC transporter substrate-binding protein [Thermomicrobium sp. 4228-Ro]MCX2726341.1 spermidine/putrescine ABC transporter substrate-binding protein [Thermomicrobium sp. 4228-Ro]